MIEAQHEKFNRVFLKAKILPENWNILSLPGSVSVHIFPDLYKFTSLFITTFLLPREKVKCWLAKFYKQNSFVANQPQVSQELSIVRSGKGRGERGGRPARRMKRGANFNICKSFFRPFAAVKNFFSEEGFY